MDILLIMAIDETGFNTIFSLNDAGYFTAARAIYLLHTFFGRHGGKKYEWREKMQLMEKQKKSPNSLIGVKAVFVLTEKRRPAFQMQKH